MTLQHTIVRDPATGRLDSRNPLGQSDPVPTKVVDVQQTGATSSSVTLSWSAATDAETYNVYVDSIDTPTLTGVTSTSTTLTGLTAETGYAVRVSATNEVGEGELSDPVTMTTSAADTEGDLSVLKAFPTAEGAGALSAGGRGGTVIYVTNLNDSGTGSLRAAIESSGPRIVVFRVGGTIELESMLYITNPYITIAGQTAPGGGIQLTFGENFTSSIKFLINCNTHDVVIQYLRLRGARNRTNTDHANLSLTNTDGGDVYNVVIDHVSMMWHEGKNFTSWSRSSTTGPRRTTLQNCILAETLSGHPVNMNIGGTTGDNNLGSVDTDVCNNLLANTNHRNPLLSNASGRFINNIVYNWYLYATQAGSGPYWDFIANKYKLGPDPIANGHDGEIQLYNSELVSDAYQTRLIFRTPSVYVAGNQGPWITNPNSDNWTQVRRIPFQNEKVIGSAPTEWKRNEPLASVGIPISVTSVLDLEDKILSHVGASKKLNDSGVLVDNRDSADARIVQSYIDNTGKTPIDNEDEVGGHPVLAAGTPYTSTAPDGISDTWKSSNGLTVSTDYSSTELTPRNNVAEGWTVMDVFLAGLNLPEGGL